MRRGGVKSFVDDLAFGLGAVRSRAATTLRSVETQPASGGFASTERCEPSGQFSFNISKLGCCCSASAPLHPDGRVLFPESVAQKELKFKILSKFFLSRTGAVG